MLIIKRDVEDLDEKLKELGFEPRYDEFTGEVEAYVKHNDLKISGVTGLGLKIKAEIRAKSRLRLFKKNFADEKVWTINCYDSYFDVDMLYDLFEAGLVEKIDGKEL